MSFKYRLILSFIIVEFIFISIIVSINFTAISNASKNLTLEKFDSNISFLEELVKVPLVVYDLATLDELTKKTTSLSYIDSIIILDSKKNILSEDFNNTFLSKDVILDLKQDKEFKFSNKIYNLVYKEIHEEDSLLGSIYVIFDNTNIINLIEKNRYNTVLLVFLEIFISFFISYYVGNKLTNMLTNLSLVAKDIGDDKDPTIPYTNISDEIGLLAKSMDKMKRDLKIKNNNILQMQKQKDNFFANMSHELKTPLNSINVISSIMLKNRDNSLNEKNLKNMSIINKCGNDLLLLINDILDISKLEANEIKLDFQDFDFRILVEDVIEMFESQSTKKGLFLNYRIDSSIGIIHNDEMRIKQIMINLLSNALKFTQNGGIELIVNEFLDKIEIVVKDTGIGIPENKLETIFERFKQVDEGINRKYGGTGLGLAICKELSKLLNGDITVESRVDVGTTFKILIQKDIYSQSGENKRKKEKKVDDFELIEEKKSLSQRKIIFLNNQLIDFMPIVIDLKKSVLKFIHTNSLEEFETNLKNEEFDLVIINTKDFFEDYILEILEKFPSQKSLILISQDESENSNLLQRANLVLKKPINKEEYIQKIVSIE